MVMDRRARGAGKGSGTSEYELVFGASETSLVRCEDDNQTSLLPGSRISRSNDPVGER